MQRYYDLTVRLLLITFVCFIYYTFLTFNFLTPEKSTFNDDFPNYYFAGLRFFNGLPVYGALKHDVFTHLGIENYQAYATDPPLTVFLLNVVSIFDYQISWWLFIALSVVCLFSAITLFLDEYDFSLNTRLALLSICFISQPFLFLLKKNHFESILLLLFVLGFKAFKKQREGIGIFWWSVAGSLKLFPIVWLLAVPNRTFLKRILYCLGTLLGSLTLGAILLGINNTVDFFTVALPASAFWQGSVGNYSIISFAAALGSYNLGIAILVLSGFLVLIWNRKTKSNVESELTIIAASLLLSPLCWINYFILLLPLFIKEIADYLSSRTLFKSLRVCLVSLFIFYPTVIKFSLDLLTILASFVPLSLLLFLTFLPSKESKNWIGKI